MENTILVPNASFLIESIRSVGYSFESAVADIIDNSVSKGAKNVDMVFECINDPFLAIIDDACGMDELELVNAMQYGSRNPLDKREADDLGRFGLGMKMASMSQCRKLTVITKKNDSTIAACWDLDHIIEKQEWSLIKYSKEETVKLKQYTSLSNKSSGTVVLWEKLDRLEKSTNNFEKTFINKMYDTECHIALIFHRFMQNSDKKKKVSFYLNGSTIEYYDPFYSNNVATQILPESNIKVEESQIKVRPYIIPHYNKMKLKDRENEDRIKKIKNAQGLYIYRNKRLIVWGKWFGLVGKKELHKLARIQVDLPNDLDNLWQIDIKKSSAQLPDSLKKSIGTAIEKAISKSKGVYKYRGRQVGNSDLITVWNQVDDRGSIRLEINKTLPIINEMYEQLDLECRGYLDTLLNMIERNVPFDFIYYSMANNEVDVSDSVEISADQIENLRNYVRAGVKQGFNKELLVEDAMNMLKFSEKDKEKCREKFKNE